MTRTEIPLYIPPLGEEEADAARRAVLDGCVDGNGPICRRVEKKMETLVGAPCLLMTSCTHALETALMLLDLGPDDEVICPSFTFVSTANAVIRCGARVVFADVTRSTLCLDPESLRQKISPRTRAIIVVHYAGIACDMRTIADIAQEANAYVIEDAAHAFGATLNGKSLGTFGSCGGFSFHSTKNLACGEGGALVVGDKALLTRAEIVREKGTNRSAFLRGEIDKYTWVDCGSSFVLSDVLAAILERQLDKHERILAGRRRAWRQYAEELAELEAAGYVTLPAIPSGCEPSWHVFYVLLHDAARRDACLDYLRANGVHAAFHYLPLHQSPFAQKLYNAWRVPPPSLPVTEWASRAIVRLPLYPTLTEEQVSYVCETLRRFFA